MKINQNYHCCFSEIDLIIMEAKTLVFVEVHLRSNSLLGSAATSITPRKQQKLNIDWTTLFKSAWQVLMPL